MKFYKINSKDIQSGIKIEQTRIPIHIMSEIYVKTSKQKKFRKIEEVFQMSIVFSEDLDFADELSNSIDSHGEKLHYTFIKDNQALQILCGNEHFYIELKNNVIHIESYQKKNKIKAG